MEMYNFKVTRVMARNRNIRPPLAEQAKPTFSSSPARLNLLHYQPPPVSPEYRGDPNYGYYNLGFVPETSQPQDLNYMTGREYDSTQGNRSSLHKISSSNTRRKTMKENLQKLEEANASPVQIIEQMREFIEREDRKTGFRAWWKQQKQQWDRFKAESRSKVRFWGLWSVTINVIEGRFGSGIASYFRFLRWLFYLDLVLTVIVLSVTTLPYAILDNYLNFDTYIQDVQKNWITNNSFVVEAQNCSLEYQNYLKLEMEKKSVADHVKDVLQGTGIMEYTILFYGSYHNVTLKIGDNKVYNYNMSLAYLLALGLFFVISFVLIIRTIAVGIKENLVNQQATGVPYSQKVFGSWDFCISVEKMVNRKKNCLLQELRADLNSQREFWMQTGRTFKLKLKLYSLRLLINIFVICLLCGSFTLIYYSSINLIELQKQTFENEFVELIIQFLPSLVISLLNVIMPVVFNILVRFEVYSSSYEIKITLVRITLLRLASLAILLFSLYGKLDLNSPDTLCSFGENNQIQCWETYVGQQFYKLIILDFVLLVLVNMLIHTIRRLLYNKFNTENTTDSDDSEQTPNSCIRVFRYLINKVGPQEFDLPQNVIEIVYHQSLCWIGIFFCPLISLIISINFFLLFFIKKFTIYHNCVQSVRPFRASKSNSLFMLAVLISFILCVLPIALAIGFFHPSRGCGPFRIYSNKDYYIFDTVSNLILNWPSIITKILFLIVTPPVLVPLIVFICFLIYYYVIVGRGYQRMEDLLREQLSLDGKDKRFLLGEVNKIMRIVFAREN